eukprot:COSAG02_NODE_799_length_17084_cov_9.741242_19_plen_71_part_00
MLKLCPGLKDRLKLVAFRPAGYDTKSGKMDFIDSTRAADFIVSSTAGISNLEPQKLEFMMYCCCLSRPSI